MTFTLNQLLAMVGRSIQNPREGAAEVLSLGIPREALWLILLIVVVLSVVLAQLTTILVGGGGGPMFDGLLASPLVTGGIQLALLVIMIAAVFFVGRAFGGTGSFEESMLLMSWLQFIMVCIQVVQTLAMLIMPPLAGLIGIAALVLFFWLMTNFVAVLHGFRSLGQVFVMIIVSGFAIAFFASIVLTILGVGMPMPTGEI
ncbi:MAG: YIP1 family protein [Rhodobacteraceae bacterium]|nr:YIP1 family protein [Alphaproteobacteria bacterium]MBT8476183.1 YIP1 family protein [Alphaproteobacteria bacterium]NNF71367.1 YIP1 family protein [Paracoccaceae bacterium]NNK67246.1 YIP1 family protein [Paracoccaceae bacterium]